MSGRDTGFRRWLAGWWHQIIARCSKARGENVRDDVELVRRQYLESEKRFRALLESLPKVAVQGYDRDRRVIYWNEASSRLYGYTPDEAQGQLIEDLIIPFSMRERVIEAHWAWLREGVEIPADELELQHKSGEPVTVFSHHVMLAEHTDDPLMFCVDVDLSDQIRARRELDFATRFDSLTPPAQSPDFRRAIGQRHRRLSASGCWTGPDLPGYRPFRGCQRRAGLRAGRSAAD